jgi:16S rRNA G527 N7-methylase RsmG
VSAGGPLGQREERLERFAQELARWGERMNLVGCTSREAIGVHIDDALADLQLTLVEARERRVHFLRHVVRTLELGAQVRCERFERSAPASFDVACLRAVGPLPAVLEPAAGWLVPGGELWLWTKLDGPELGLPVRGRVELGAARGRIVRLAPEPAGSPVALR